MNKVALTNFGTSLRDAIIPLLLVLQAILLPTPVKANDYLQCVPFARSLSGIEIYGDAHSWWDKAAGKYRRGTTPAEGAVLSLPGHGSMRLGHVAVVRKIIDERNILISHANWSPINGRGGQIERRVAAQDVSKNNDWSKIRIWYAPIGKLGTTAFPVNGFIYPEREIRRDDRQWASAKPQRKDRRPRRSLFDRALKTELARSAAQERRDDAEPTDLIGDLLDRVGS